MAHTYQELREKTVAELREIADQHEHEALRGHKTMHKEELLLALCKALGIDAHAHHQVVGIDKTAIKRRIRELKKERDQAVGTHDAASLKRSRRKIHRLKRQIKKATV